MSNNKKNIFISIQDEELQPPEELFQNIWKEIGGVSNNLSPEKPSEDFTTEEISVFKSLQIYSETSPSYEASEISNVINSSSRKSVPVIQFFKFNNWGRIAAAILVVLISSGIIFTIYHIKQHQSSVIVNRKTPTNKAQIEHQKNVVKKR